MLVIKVYDTLSYFCEYFGYTMQRRQLLCIKKENIFFFKDQVKSNPYKRHVSCLAIPVTSRSTISI